MARTKAVARLSMDQLRGIIKREGSVGRSFNTVSISANGGNTSGHSSVVAEVQEDTLNLVAGANITLTADENSDTITIAGVSTSSNSFETISLVEGSGTVTGDSSVVADSGTDTLTLIAGDNITLNGAANRDWITISTDQGESFKTISLGSSGNGNASGDSSVVADSINDTLTLTAGNNITLTGNASGDAITIAAADYGDAGIATFSVNDDSGNDVGNLRFDAGTGISLSDASDKLTINISDAVATHVKISGNTTGDTSVSIDNNSVANTVELVGGDGINLTGNNSAGQIMIVATGSQSDGLNEEQVEDVVGAMFSSNTETLISATYDDSDGKVNLVVDNDLSNYDNSSSGFATSSYGWVRVDGPSSGHADHIDMRAESQSNVLTFIAGENIVLGAVPDADAVTISAKTAVTVPLDQISGLPVDNEIAIWTGSTILEGDGKLLWNGSTMMVSGNIELSGNLGVNVTGSGITHGITLPNTADSSGIVKANAYVTYSSLKFKENVSEIQDPINTIMSMRGVTFDWKQNGKKDYGFIAEEVDQVMPEIVFKDDSPTGVSSMDYQKIVPVLLEAIKTQQSKIESLENKLSELTHAYEDNKK